MPLPKFEIIGYNDGLKEEAKEIVHNGKRLAMVIRKNNPSGKKFFSAKDDYLQVGLMNLSKWERIIPHFHKEFVREVKKTQEVLYIVSGKMRVSFYVDKEKVDEVTVEGGDLLVLIDGGHGFEFLEETNLIEIKQGPYLDFEKDKERF